MKKQIAKILTSTTIVFALILTNTVPTFAVDTSPISISYTTKVVHISNNTALKSFLSKTSSGSIYVARRARSEYFSTYRSDIKVSELSMAIEIVGHVYPDKIARYIPFGLGSSILSHTAIIDSGERSVDSNRWVWDSIAATVGAVIITPPMPIMTSSRSLSFQLSIEERVDAIIKNNKNLELNKDIMIKVMTDIDDGTIDPLLLEILK